MAFDFFYMQIVYLEIECYNKKSFCKFVKYIK